MIRFAVVIGALVVSTVVVLAQGGQKQFTPGTVKYRLMGGGDKLHDKPDSACKLSVELLAKTGNKNTFVRVKDGPHDLSMTCVLRSSSDGKEWTQDNIVEKKMICADGKESISMDNSGTWKSQGCPCDPDKGCPAATGSGSAAPPAGSGSADPCAMFANNEWCTSNTDRSARCTQQPAQRKSKKAIAMASAKNKRGTLRDRRLYKAYQDEKRRIEDELVARGEDKGGVALTRADAFPKFEGDDMCPGTNDINIGPLCGNYAGDFAAANNVAGYGSTPEGCTWHHHQTMGRMQLVKTSAHDFNQGGPRHTGGVAIYKAALGMKDKYPMCCPQQPAAKQPPAKQPPAKQPPKAVPLKRVDK